MAQLDTIRQPIEAEMLRFRQMFAATLTSSNPLLSVALAHITQRGGKAMRPMLTLLSARAAGQVGDGVLHAALALELLHTASLVHDDIVDESDRRRGQKSVNALLGNKAAVLVGDFLFSRALHHAALTGSVRVVEWLAQLGQTLSDGELQQLANLDSDDLSLDAYYHVIDKKTASLFMECGRMGAHLAGGGQQTVDSLARFGLIVGRCFQIRDDILDYEDASVTGKPTGNDMREGKLTLPVLLAIRGEEAHQRLALRVRRGDATEAEIAQLVALTRQSGSLSAAMQTMDDHCQEALALIPPSTPVASALHKYAYFAAARRA